MFVGQERLVVSRKVGQEFKKMGVKKIACLNQEVGNTALDERAKGLAEGFGAKGVVVAAGDSIKPRPLPGKEVDDIVIADGI
jgi:hypothetical protein